jgi:outer membrane protein assembly factor BamA
MWILAGKSISKALPFLLPLLLLVLLAPLYPATDLKVQKIVFTGNHAFSQNELKDILKSKEKERFNSRYLKLDQILITNYYTQNGYLDVYVSGNFEKEGNNITLQYDIREGTRYYFKEMKFLGNEL